MRRPGRTMRKMTRSLPPHRVRFALWGLAGSLAACLVTLAAVRWHDRSAAVPCAGVDSTCALPGSAGRTAKAPGGDRGDLPPGPAVVEFTADACPACRKMEPVLKDARDQCAAAGASIVQVDVETPAGGGLAARWSVKATPTLVLLDAGHQEVARLVGSRSLGDVRGAIEQAYGVACTADASAPRPRG